MVQKQKLYLELIWSELDLLMLTSLLIQRFFTFLYANSSDSVHIDKVPCTYVCKVHTVCSYICMIWFPAASQKILPRNVNMCRLTAEQVRPVQNIYDPHGWNYPPPPGYVGTKSGWVTILYFNIYSMVVLKKVVITMVVIMYSLTIAKGRIFYPSE